MGIDPGWSGGIALVVGSLGTAYKMPETLADIKELIRTLKKSGVRHCFLESVHSMPKQGVASSFTFGRNFGICEMALACLEIPYTLVSPQKWMNTLNCRTGGDKRITKIRAQQLFPEIKVTLATAEALLIAVYGRQTLTSSKE